MTRRSEFDLTNARQVALVRAVAADAIDSQFASASRVSREFKGVSLARAERLLNLLTEHGILGPDQGPEHTRVVLITPDQRRAVLDLEFPYPTNQEGEVT